MKIVQILPNLTRGGAERICLDICHELIHQGHNVYLILLEDKIEYNELLSGVPFQIIQSDFIPSVLGKSKTNLAKLQKFIDIFEPDIIHSHLYKADLVAFNLNSNAKHISHIHSCRKELNKNLKGDSIKNKIIFKTERKTFKNLLKRKNVMQIAISKDTLNFAIIELGQKLNKNVILLHNCIDFSKFKGVPKQLPPKKQSIKLINIGRFVPKKNQIFLIEVANYLQSKNIDFNLSLLGDGNLLDQSKIKAKESQLEKRINFLGMISNPEDHLKSSTIYIHSALEEPFGLVLIEAMAAGVPVITLDGKGNRDIIKEGENGFMIWDKSVEKFGQKIIELVNTPEEYNKISKFAINYASKYNVKNYIINLLSIYNSELTK